MAKPTYKRMTNSRMFNLRGKQFGELSVIRLAPKRHKGHRMWVCKCSCGNTVVVRHDYLLHTNHPKTHCGCKNKGFGTIHNAEYRTWYAMIQRCYNPATAGYKYYGGRGIKVCQAWLNSFETFYNDVGPKPSKNHSIDRIDSNGDYEPSNVRWVTTKVQARNKRGTVYLPHPITGNLIPAAELAENMGISYQALRTRYIKAGKWPGVK